MKFAGVAGRQVRTPGAAMPEVEGQRQLVSVEVWLGLGQSLPELPGGFDGDRNV